MWNHANRVEFFVILAQLAPQTPKKKKRASVPNKSELPVLIPIEDKKVKTKRSNSKRASASANKKLKVQVQTELKEPHRDGSPKSHFDLTFHFPHQSVPESATNLFPAVFSPDLNFDNMIFGECPSEFTSLLDMIPDKSIESPMPMWNDLLSIEDLNGDNDINFPEFNWWGNHQIFRLQSYYNTIRFTSTLVYL